jgi:hypothetical protein
MRAIQQAARDAERRFPVFPYTRALAAKLSIAWPEEFETATRKHLQQEFRGECDVSW